MSYLHCDCGFVGDESEFETVTEHHGGDYYPDGGVDFCDAVCPECGGIDNEEISDAEAHEILHGPDEEDDDA